MPARNFNVRLPENLQEALFRHIEEQKVSNFLRAAIAEKLARDFGEKVEIAEMVRGTRNDMKTPEGKAVAEKNLRAARARRKLSVLFRGFEIISEAIKAANPIWKEYTEKLLPEAARIVQEHNDFTEKAGGYLDRISQTLKKIDGVKRECLEIECGVKKMKDGMKKNEFRKKIEQRRKEIEQEQNNIADELKALERAIDENLIQCGQMFLFIQNLSDKTSQAPKKYFSELIAEIETIHKAEKDAYEKIKKLAATAESLAENQKPLPEN